MSVHYLPQTPLPFQPMLAWQLEINHKADLILVKQRVLKQSKHFSNESVISSELALVATELCQNLLDHSNGGIFNFDFNQHTQEITLSTQDQGPGILDIDLAIQDGYSSAGKLGLGLGVINRIMDTLLITSHPQQGTTTTATRHLLPNSNDTIQRLEIGAATRSHPQMTHNGDAYFIHKTSEKVIIVLIDGIGHGQNAWAAAQISIQTITQHLNEHPEFIMQQIHRASLATRGCVACLLSFDLTQKTVTHAGIGNIICHHFYNNEDSHFVSQRGTLGARLPSRIHVNKSHFSPGDVFILYTDGINDDWSWFDYPHLHPLPAEQIAKNLLKHHSRHHDDASILVINTLMKITP